MKDNDKVSVDETSATYAYFEVKDTDGKEISNYGDYKVESSDRATLMLAADTMTGSNHYVRVIPAKEGTTYIFLKKDDKIVASVPVTVVASRKVTTMTTDKNSFTLSKTSVANEIVSLTTKISMVMILNILDLTKAFVLHARVPQKVLQIQIKQLLQVELHQHLLGMVISLLIHLLEVLLLHMQREHILLIHIPERW